MYATGSRRSRRRTISPNNRAAAGARSACGFATSSALSHPVASASITSESRRGSSMPMAASASADALRASRTGATSAGGTSSNRSRLKALSLLLGSEGIRELREVAAEHAVEVVRGQLDPVVGDPALGEVVGAHLLRALAAADLGLALGGDLRLLFGQLALIQPRPQHPHRPVLVLKLGLLVLHRDHD